MNHDLISYQPMRYSVSTTIFEGPLDLLLTLIERAELDISTLALAQVTDQFLQYLNDLQTLAVDELSSFLVIAAKLLQIKSEMLLPRPPIRKDGEEDPAETLARQLMAYKRYKEVASLLDQRKNQGFHTYIRLTPPPKTVTKVEFGEFGLNDLFALAQEIFTREESKPDLQTVVAAPKVTIRQKIRMISSQLQHLGRSNFKSFISTSSTRLEIVVTFLALLELIKQRVVNAQQTDIFGDIELELSGQLVEDEELELEFGE
jgi:segregation and condensation protein A